MLDDTSVGRSVFCTHCGGPFLVPAPRPPRTIVTSAAAAERVVSPATEAAQTQVAQLTAENIGLQVELGHRRRRQQRLAMALSGVQRILAAREQLDHTLGRIGGFFIAVALCAALVVVVVSWFAVGALSVWLAAVAAAGLAGAAYLALVFYPEDSTLHSAIGRLSAKYQDAAARFDEQAALEAEQRQRLRAAEAELRRLSSELDGTAN